MRKWRVANVVKQSRELHQFSVVGTDAPGVGLVERCKQSASEMVRSKGMCKSVVGGAREHEFAGRQLLDVPQALKFTRVEDGGVSGRHEDVTVHFVTDDPVRWSCHR